jgi:hypothetical protein
MLGAILKTMNLDGLRSVLLKEDDAMIGDAAGALRTLTVGKLRFGFFEGETFFVAPSIRVSSWIYRNVVQ